MLHQWLLACVVRQEVMCPLWTSFELEMFYAAQIAVGGNRRHTSLAGFVDTLARRRGRRRKTTGRYSCGQQYLGDVGRVMEVCARCQVGNGFREAHAQFVL